MNIRREINESVDKQKLFMLSMAYLCSDKDLLWQNKIYGWKCNINTNDNVVKDRLKFLEIQNSEDLKQKIDWFLNTGFRKDFNEKMYFLKGFSSKARKDHINSLSEDDEQYKKLFIVEYYMNKLPLSTITAYDYSWCCYLYFAGNALGYISDNETWRLVKEVSQNIQKAYSGWEYYVTSYAAGAQFHALDTEFNFIKKNSKFFERYFLSPKSPANRIEWEIEL